MQVYARQQVLGGLGNNQADAMLDPTMPVGQVVSAFKKRHVSRADNYTESDDAAVDALEDLDELMRNMDANFVILDDLDDQERRFRQMIIQRRLGRPDKEAPDFEKVTAARNNVANMKELLRQSGMKEKSITGAFLIFLAKQIGLKEKSSDWSLLSWVLVALQFFCGLIFWFGYLALLAFQIYQIKHGDSSGNNVHAEYNPYLPSNDYSTGDPISTSDSSNVTTTTATPVNPFGSTLFVVTKQATLGLMVFASFHSRLFLRSLVRRDRLMLAKTVQFTDTVSSTGGHYLVLVVLGVTYMGLQSTQLYYDSGVYSTEEDVNRYATPVLLTCRLVTEVLGVWYTMLINLVLSAWCQYISRLGNKLKMDLDEDNALCEYNLFVKSYTDKDKDRKAKIENFSIMKKEDGPSEELRTFTPLTNEEILVRHIHLRERVDFTSKRFGLWLLIQLGFVALYSLDYIVRFLDLGSDLFDLIEFIVVLVWFGLFSSSVARLNSQLGNLTKHVFPLPSRGGVFALVAANPCHVTVYGGSLTYPVIIGLFLAVCVALSTRLLVQF